MLKYHATIKEHDNGTFEICAIDVPECTATGATFEEAFDMATALLQKKFNADNMALPTPRTFNEVIADPTVKSNDLPLVILTVQN